MVDETLRALGRDVTREDLGRCARTACHMHAFVFVSIRSF